MESIINILKHIFKNMILMIIDPWKDYPWKEIGNVLSLSLQLYCINFCILFSCLLILPLLSIDGYILSNIFNFIYGYFVLGYKIHLWFFGMCLLFVISEEI